jgi:ABC-type Fe3+ transport system substrate-binding protein
MRNAAERTITSFLLLVTSALLGCGRGAPGLPAEEVVNVPAQGSVVVFVEAPRRIAGPVLKTFEEQTGIQVSATYREDLGEGFMATLKAQAERGAADFFWAETPLAAYDMVDAGLAAPFRPLGARPVPGQYRDREFRWIGFAVNPRVIIYNSNRLKPEEAPARTTDLIRAPFAGKGAMPRIASGAPAFHAATLMALWGPEKGRQFFEAVRSDGGTRIVENDREVRRLVAEGGATWGLIGLDQAICAKREAEPVNILFPDRLGSGAVMPPHAVMLLRDAPHPAQAKGLFGYLFTTESGWALGQNDCALITLLPNVPHPSWVPNLAALNVAKINPAEAWKIYRDNAAYLSSWGAEQAPAAAPTSQPRAALDHSPRP